MKKRDDLNDVIREESSRGRKRPINTAAINEKVSYSGDCISLYTHCGTHIDSFSHFGLHGEIFNIGFQNHSIADIAQIVKRVVEEEMPEKGDIKITTTLSNDTRSYHVNSDKVKRVLGFVPRRSIEDAVRDLTRAFRNCLMPDSFDNDWYYNVRTMKKLGAK